VSLSKNIKKGFTLIEILLVVAILSILLVVVFAALNPAQRLQDTRNARRWNDVNQVLTAVHEYIVDNKGTCPTGVNCTTQATVELGTCAAGAANCPALTGVANCVDLRTPLASYLASIPKDPSVSGTTNSGYAIGVANGIVTITACHAEGGQSISVAR
jgi:prepilin-type N-terminal cleavage/methylation domain-containing protein